MDLFSVINRQRGHLFCWVPVFLAVGIGLYFALPVEPDRWSLLALGCAVALLILAALRAPEALAPVVLAVALVGAGTGLGAWRTHHVTAPMLEFRYYGPVQGRLIGIDRSVSDKTRLLFDQVILSKVGPQRTPARVRVSLHGDRQYDTALIPGRTLMLTAHLSGPNGPVEPGGFDFRRHAWFLQIGAVGYSRTPVLAVAEGERSAWIILQRFRTGLSAAVQERLPGQQGAFAAAVLTGDRSALSRETIDAMRATNLAHLLAISGLHMGLLTAVIFGVLRTAIALIPALALRVNGKKWAAVGALGAAAVYLGLSGGNVSTQRAFIMVSVMLCAILLDRRALTLRAVAVAACIILLLRPEALLGPGFQMSFAATTCLVWVFGVLRARRERQPEPQGPRPKWKRRLKPVGALVISSAVAGLATAPIGMAHFNSSASYGLLANLVSVPIMGTFVMPAAVFAGALSALGLEQIGLWVMGQGIGLILAVAHGLEALPGAVRTVPSPPALVLPLLAFGALWGMLWQGWLRAAGALAMVAAIAVWSAHSRPDVLISEDGKLIGIMGVEGRALSRARGNGFAARAWLENDGDPSERAEAFARWDRLGAVAELDALAARARRDDLCGPQALSAAFDALELGPVCPSGGQPSGAVALYRLAEGGWSARTVRADVGQRPWTPPAWRTAPRGPRSAYLARQ